MAGKSKVEKIELSDQEKKTIQAQRELTKKKTECAKAIGEVLQGFQAELMVNPNSPIGSPEIIITLK